MLAGCVKAGRLITRADLDDIVRTSDKQRFAISDDGTQIRANQGHSAEVELGHAPAEPPAVLYHGTSVAAAASIRATGLEKRTRHHVHLSEMKDTALKVGGRHGKPLVLIVDAAAMRRAGMEFFLTPNGVWPVDAVPPKYLKFPD